MFIFVSPIYKMVYHINKKGINMGNRELYNKIISLYKINNTRELSFIKMIDRYAERKYTKVLYMKDETIFEEGAVGNTIYAIDRGKVIYTKKDMSGREYCCGYFKSGEFFDISSFIEAPYVVNYKALTNCSIYQIKVSDIRDSLNIDDFDKLFCINIIKLLRLMLLRQGNIEKGACRSAFTNFMTEYIYDCGRIDSDDNIILDLDLNLAEIAIILNMTKETLSRILSEMKKEKIIETKRRYMKILDLARFLE